VGNEVKVLLDVDVTLKRSMGKMVAALDGGKLSKKFTVALTRAELANAPRLGGAVSPRGAPTNKWVRVS
jgi:hypothetical protein